jgi:hypothetical protein
MWNQKEVGDRIKAAASVGKLRFIYANPKNFLQASTHTFEETLKPDMVILCRDSTSFWQAYCPIVEFREAKYLYNRTKCMCLTWPQQASGQSILPQLRTRRQNFHNATVELMNHLLCNQETTEKAVHPWLSLMSQGEQHSYQHSWNLFQQSHRSPYPTSSSTPGFAFGTSGGGNSSTQNLQIIPGNMPNEAPPSQFLSPEGNNAQITLGEGVDPTLGNPGVQSVLKDWDEYVRKTPSHDDAEWWNVNKLSTILAGRKLYVACIPVAPETAESPPRIHNMFCVGSGLSSAVIVYLVKNLGQAAASWRAIIHIPRGERRPNGSVRSTQPYEKVDINSPPRQILINRLVREDIGLGRVGTRDQLDHLLYLPADLNNEALKTRLAESYVQEMQSFSTEFPLPRPRVLAASAHLPPSSVPNQTRAPPLNKDGRLALKRTAAETKRSGSRSRSPGPGRRRRE